MKSTVSAMPSSTLQRADARAGKYLTFRLEKEEFAIQVRLIREIMSAQQITPLPQTPEYVKGAISLRGKLIPVIDLKAKFGMVRTEPTPRSSIIVSQIDSQAGRLTVGTLVDCVTEVLTFHPGEIEDIPERSGPVKSCLLGVVKLKGKVKSLFDINALLTAQEVHELEAVLPPAVSGD